MGVLDHVGGAKTAHQGRGEAKPIDGEYLLEPFEQARGGIRVIALQPLGLLFHSGQALLLGELVGSHHDRLGLRLDRFVGEAIEDVAQLVRTAALHRSRLAEDLLDGGAQRLRAVRSKGQRC